MSSSALRLPNLAQNNTAAAFTTAAVEMRGKGLPSAMGAMTSRDRSKIFSEYAIGRRRTVIVSFLEDASIPARKPLQ